LKSNNKISQQNRELGFFRNFIKSLDFEKYSFDHLDTDPPDFVFRNDIKETIGVELCELWDTNNQKDVLSAYDKIIKYSKEEFHNLSQLEICVSFHFRGRIDVSNNNYKNVGSLISSWIYNHLDDYYRLVDHSLSYSNPIEDITELEEIKFIKCDNCSKRGWFYDPQLIYGGQLKEEDLLKSVKKKQSQITSWNKGYSYDQKWLLLICTGESSSLFSDYGIDRIYWSEYSDFDRIYIFDDFCRENTRCK
jgi:hypothetical protein